MKVLLLPDVPGWAFDINLRAMARYLTDVEFRFHYLNAGEPSKADIMWADAVYVPWHPWEGVERVRGMGAPVLSSLRSEFFDTRNPGPPTEADIRLVNSFHGFHCVTKKVYDQLRHSCPRLVYLTNPVDVEPYLLPPIPIMKEEDDFAGAWCGSVSHEGMTGTLDAKGFYSIILPACDRAGVRLTYCEYHTNRRAPQEMPQFYAGAAVYLCASEYEGASNAVMEALTAGLFVIATDCGNHRELRDSGCEGMVLVPRTVEAFTEALESGPGMKFDARWANRRTMVGKWSWAAWADRYRKFLEMAL